MLGILIGTIAIVLVTVAVGLLVDRKTPLLPAPAQLRPDADARKKAATHGIGEAPSTALGVRADGLDKLRSSQRCPQCRTAMTLSAPDDQIRYNGADLLVCHFECPTCQTRRTLYVQSR